MTKGKMNEQTGQEQVVCEDGGAPIQTQRVVARALSASSSFKDSESVVRGVWLRLSGVNDSSFPWRT